MINYLIELYKNQYISKHGDLNENAVLAIAKIRLFSLL